MKKLLPILILLGVATWSLWPEQKVGGPLSKQLLTEKPKSIRTEIGKRWGDLYEHNTTHERLFVDSVNPNYYLIAEREKGHPELDGYTWIGSGDMPIYKDTPVTLLDYDFNTQVENSPTTTAIYMLKLPNEVPTLVVSLPSTNIKTLQ